jgi:hypothetical protein
MNDKVKSVFRLPKRHAGKSTDAGPELGRRLVNEQSLPNALFAGLIIIIVFSALWAMASTLFDRILPWMTLVLGILIGLAVRRAGRGLDWRFPVLAAALAVFGSLISNIVVAAAFTAVALDTSTLHILRAVTSMTWPVFFDEALSVVDIIYGFVAAALAAFYANRRLTRAEFHALRTRSDGH